MDYYRASIYRDGELDESAPLVNVDHSALAAMSFITVGRDVEAFIGDRRILVFEADEPDCYRLEVKGFVDDVRSSWASWTVIETPQTVDVDAESKKLEVSR